MVRQARARAVPDSRGVAAAGWRSIARCWPFVRPYTPVMLALLLLVVLDAVVGLAPPLLIRRIIDVALPRSDLTLLDVLVVEMLGLYLLDALLTLLIAWIGVRVANAITYRMRLALYDHVQRLPVGFFVHTDPGSVQSRLMMDVRGAQQLFTSTLSSSASSATSLVVTLVIMSALSWQATAVALLLIPFFLGPARLVGGWQQDLARRQLQSFAELSAFMGERFQVAGAVLVKLYGLLDEQLVNWSRLAAAVRDVSARIGMLTQVYATLLTLLAVTGLSVVYLVGGHALVAGALTLGTLVALATYLQRLYGPLQQLSGLGVDAMAGLVSFERVSEVLQLPTAAQDAPPIARPPIEAGRLDLVDVCFRYPSRHESSLPSLQVAQGGPDGSAFRLRGVSFSCLPGTVTALVGRSGAGKTTLAMLIARLYDVTSGAVLLDGVDLRHIGQERMCDYVGMVTQDVFLFHDTVSVNLRCAKPSASQTELETACKAVRLHDLLSSLPAGYDTVVGDRGHRFSGGEKQRLAMARILLRDPRVVILDEATAHLDYQAEAEIQDAIRSLFTGRTAIVIAHRLSTVIDADQVVVLEDGSLVELGDHDRLVGGDGAYARLYGHAGRENGVEPGHGPRRRPGSVLGTREWEGL